MKAIVDCNSFYCSCERVFRPELDGVPVVVLSNNDGCIIAQSAEARVLGIGDFGPYFKAREVIEQHGVRVFSSNYALYGDLSRRVMDTLAAVVGKENVEIYSVDEAFLDLKAVPDEDLETLAQTLKQTVETWTGVKVSVGIAPTKTLAKVANRLCKRQVPAQGWLVLDTPQKIALALQQTRVGSIWGVGRKYADRLESLSIHTAWDLRALPEGWLRKHLGGVVGLRLHHELHGREAIILDRTPGKKMIATTRMFGEPVTSLTDIKEAVATYAAQAAQKLRKQRSAATLVQVFVVRKGAGTYSTDYTCSSHCLLPYATCLTQDFIAAATRLAVGLYEEGARYKKAGVLLSGIVPDQSIQASLFERGASAGKQLMHLIDNINVSMGSDTVKFAASGTQRNWKMRQQELSPLYTTSWTQLYEVR